MTIDEKRILAASAIAGGMLSGSPSLANNEDKLAESALSAADSIISRVAGNSGLVDAALDLLQKIYNENGLWLAEDGYERVEEFLRSHGRLGVGSE